MSKPVLLDLFSGAGGAARGYQQAGFYVVGVDIKPQKHYAGDEFIQADAMTFPLDGFDAIHASPPCQHWVDAANKAKHPDLITPLRPRLVAAGVPYVIENVDKAPLLNKLTLCGTMFNLQVIRHRCFETHPTIYFPPATCCHWGSVAAGDFAPVYGHGSKGRRYLEWLEDGNYARRRVGRAPTPPDFLAWCQRSMGIDWMPWRSLVEAIPPAYTQYIGTQLMREVLSREQAQAAVR